MTESGGAPRRGSWRVGTVLVLATLCLPGVAVSQGRGGGVGGHPGHSSGHRAELIGYGGWRWTSSIDATINTMEGPRSGNFDLENSGFYGFAADIAVESETQMRLSWERQDTKAVLRSQGESAETEAAVEYWHIGAVQGVRQGNLLPYGMVTLGGTRYIFEEPGDVWKFSIILGGGAKLFLNDKVGLLAQVRLPFTFLSGGFGFSTGSDGATATIVGTGIVQFDVGLGVMVLLGS